MYPLSSWQRVLRRRRLDGNTYEQTGRDHRSPIVINADGVRCMFLDKLNVLISWQSDDVTKAHQSSRQYIFTREAEKKKQ